MPGLTAQWGHVSTITSYRGIIGRAFQSCTDTEYYLDKWPLQAAILLDAAHPGTPPAPIPDMTPVAGTPNVFNAPGSGFGDTITTQRLPNAWLVVAGGSGAKQRLAVLRHLHPTIRP